MPPRIKKLLKDSFIYGFSGVLSRFATLITVPVYSRVLGVDAFGILDLYITIGAVLFVLAEVQIGSGFMRDYYDCKKSNEHHQLLGSVLGFYTASYLFYLVVIVFLLYLFSESFPQHAWNLVPIILAIFPRQLIYIAGILLRLEGQATQFLSLNLSHFFLVAAFGVVYVFQFDGEVKGVLFASLLAQCVVSVFAIKLILRHVSISFNKRYLKPLLHYSVPIVPAVLGGWALDAVGRIIIANELTPLDLGIYALLVKVAMIMILAIQAFRMTWEPIMVKKMSESGGEETFARILPHYFVVSFAFIILILAFSPFVMAILGGELTQFGLFTLGLLLLGYAWQGSINIIAAGNAYKRKTYLNSIGSLSGAFICVLITVALVNQLGILAAGLGFMIGMMLSFCITFYFAQSIHHINYNYTVIIGYGVLTVLAALLVVTAVLSNPKAYSVVGL
ncbi:lipopolysaccharide biosynthesis protein [Paraneptunicella aestuarii]|uniref:lipopolysaccharide biosynthesis protein n=1 Tax=Paraneptunicella aestuarii TaxID=2831148 RepID=UPI001E5EC935|nr:lipopolysaccharide biosynthesis protein [Paraneptunicella aestuarii]UAA39681.1 lipopolysaccharide biosynthesis protein [Paraneptunicella aestuarii]